MNLRAALTDNLALKATSVLLAMGAWFLAQGEQIYHATIEAPVDYLWPEPADRLVLMNDDAPPDPVRLRVSGSRIAVNRLVQKAREVEIRYVVDLREAEAGRTVHSFLRPPGGVTDEVQVDTVSPAETELVFDETATVTVPVLLRTRGTLPTGFVEVSRGVLPASATLTGSKRDLQSLEFVQTVPLRLDNLKAPFEGTVSLDLGQLHVLADAPRSVQVTFAVEEAQAEQEFSALSLETSEAWDGYDVTPTSCLVRLKGPVPVLEDLRRGGRAVRLGGTPDQLVFPPESAAVVIWSPSADDGAPPAVRVVIDHPRAAEVELVSVRPEIFKVKAPPEPPTPESTPEPTPAPEEGG